MDSAAFRPASDNDIRHQQAVAEGQYKDEINEKENAAAILCHQIRESPKVTDAYSTGRRGQYKTQLTAEVSGLLSCTQILSRSFRYYLSLTKGTSFNAVKDSGKNIISQ